MFSRTMGPEEICLCLLESVLLRSGEETQVKIQFFLNEVSINTCRHTLTPFNSFHPLISGITGASRIHTLASAGTFRLAV